MGVTPQQQAEQVTTRLRKRGFVVVVDDMDPRPWTFNPKAVLLHHTASTSRTDLDLERGDVAFIKRDQPDWPAPHAQWYVGRTGRIYRICKGGANHAGSGGGLVDHGIPRDLGNEFMWGIENQSAGLARDWTPEEWTSCHALTGELLTVMNQPVHQVWRHKDYDDDSGKIDTQYSLDAHREAVRLYLSGEQEDDVMQKEDWDRLEKIVENKVNDGIERLLNTDVTAEGEAPKVSVRAALRKAAKS